MHNNNRDIESRERPRVLVVDDASQTRETFHLAYPGVRVVGSYPSVDLLIQDSRASDLVVLDLLLSTQLEQRGVLQGPAAIAALATRGYRVCMYTDERRPLVLARCLASGANGFARKADSLSTNETTFCAVASGEVVISQSLVGFAELLNRRGKLPDLTAKQVEVLSARARGEQWESIAERLHIVKKTAEGHLNAVSTKMAWFLRDAMLDAYASPGDIERALGLSPGDLMGPM